MLFRILNSLASSQPLTPWVNVLATWLNEYKWPFSAGMLTYIIIPLTFGYQFILGTIDTMLPAKMQFAAPVIEYMLNLSSTLFAAGLTIIFSHYLKRYLDKKTPIV